MMTGDNQFFALNLDLLDPLYLIWKGPYTPFRELREYLLVLGLHYRVKLVLARNIESGLTHLRGNDSTYVLRPLASPVLDHGYKAFSDETLDLGERFEKVQGAGGMARQMDLAVFKR